MQLKGNAGFSQLCVGHFLPMFRFKQRIAAFQSISMCSTAPGVVTDFFPPDGS